MMFVYTSKQELELNLRNFGVSLDLRSSPPYSQEVVLYCPFYENLQNREKGEL